MYIYKITNLKTKEFYIGKREAWTGRPDLDQYMGSGNIISIWKKAGAPMVKTILLETDDKSLLHKLESVFIQHNYNNDMCKNISYGSRQVEKTYSTLTINNDAFAREPLHPKPKQKYKIKAMGPGLAALLYDYDKNGNRVSLNKY